MSYESVQEMFSRMAAEFGSQVAIARAGRGVTYASVETESNRLANFLLEGGTGKGTLVGLLTDDGVDHHGHPWSAQSRRRVRASRSVFS